MKQQKNLITLHRGEVLFRQGEYGSSMFEVVQGRLDIVADEGKKTETRIATMEQGQCFGVSGILECTPRIATAVAAEDVVVVQKISAEEFAFYFLENQEKVPQQCATWAHCCGRWTRTMPGCPAPRSKTRWTPSSVPALCGRRCCVWRPSGTPPVTP